MRKLREWWIFLDNIHELQVFDKSLSEHWQEHGYVPVHVVEYSAYESVVRELESHKEYSLRMQALANKHEKERDEARAENIGLLQLVDGQAKQLEDVKARSARLVGALEWIVESGKRLYENEIANEPFVALTMQYRNHRIVAEKALQEYLEGFK